MSLKRKRSQVDDESTAIQPLSKKPRLNLLESIWNKWKSKKEKYIMLTTYLYFDSGIKPSKCILNNCTQFDQSSVSYMYDQIRRNKRAKKDEFMNRIKHVPATWIPMIQILNVMTSEIDTKLEFENFFKIKLSEMLFLGSEFQPLFIGIDKDMLGIIFSYLSLDTLISLLLVCKTFYSIVIEIAPRKLHFHSKSFHSHPNVLKSLKFVYLYYKHLIKNLDTLTAKSLTQEFVQKCIQYFCEDDKYVRYTHLFRTKLPLPYRPKVNLKMDSLSFIHQRPTYQIESLKVKSSNCYILSSEYETVKVLKFHCHEDHKRTYSFPKVEILKIHFYTPESAHLFFQLRFENWLNIFQKDFPSLKNLICFDYTCEPWKDTEMWTTYSVSYMNFADYELRKIQYDKVWNSIQSLGILVDFKFK